MQITKLLNPTPRRAMEAHQTLLNRSLERLATGKRINRASDDPAGLVAVEPMKADLHSAEKRLERLEFSSHRLATKDGYLAEFSDLLTQLQGLVVEAGNRETMDDAEKEALQIEAESILDAIDLLSSTAEFNGTLLLEGFSSAHLGGVMAPAADGDEEEGGAGGGSGAGGAAQLMAALAKGEVTLKKEDETARAEALMAALAEGDDGWLTLADFRRGGRLNLIDGDLELAQESAKGAAQTVASQRGGIGAQMQEIESERRTLQTEIENLSAAIGQIEDADFAKETAELVRAQVLREASVRAQTIAHQNAQQVLSLIRPAKG